LAGGIIACHLDLMALHPDSLVARKRGPDEAEEASRRARQVLDTGWKVGRGDWQLLERFDTWVREGGHTHIPGTTADLVAWCLFFALHESSLSPLHPFR
jgi:triphosphoribosyl-dephospho-CoA synthase